MKRPVLLFLLLGALSLVCSDNPTDSTDNTPDPPNTDSLFLIHYTTDPAATVSEAIAASAGGTIDLTCSDSVRISLTIPPHSLSADTTVTLAPLASFSVDGPATATCICGDTTVGICLPGVVCSPAGLVFDSGATLDVVFPASQPFDFDSGATVAYFSSDDSLLYACSTAVIPAQRRLSCIIGHFSGYVTSSFPSDDDQDPCAPLYIAHNRVRAEVQAVYGTEYFYSSLSRVYEVLRGNVRHDPDFPNQYWIPCPQFTEFVDSEVATMLREHTEILLQLFHDVPATPAVISNLISHHQRMQQLVAVVSGPQASTALSESTRTVHLRVNSLVRAMISSARTECIEGDCEAGEDLLEAALGFGHQGYIVNADLSVDTDHIAQIAVWLEDCCADDFDLTLTSPISSAIYRVAASPEAVYADPYRYACTLHVKVTAPGGTGMAGIPVRLRRAGYGSSMGTIQSNDDGEVGFIIQAGQVDWVCQEYEDWEFYVLGYRAEEEDWIESNHVTVRFINVSVTTTLQYQCTYDWNPGGGPMANAHATLSGSGTGPGRATGYCVAACDGSLARDYTATNCIYSHEDSQYVCYTYRTIGGDSTYACRAMLGLQSVLLDNGMTVEFPYKVTVNLSSMVFAGIITESSAGSVDTLSYGLEFTMWPEAPLVWYLGYGEFTVDTTWSDEVGPPDLLGTKIANLQVTVSVE